MERATPRRRYACPLVDCSTGTSMQKAGSAGIQPVETPVARGLCRPKRASPRDHRTRRLGGLHAPAPPFVDCATSFLTPRIRRRGPDAARQTLTRQASCGGLALPSSDATAYDPHAARHSSLPAFMPPSSPAPPPCPPPPPPRLAGSSATAVDALTERNACCWHHHAPAHSIVVEFATRTNRSNHAERPRVRSRHRNG